MLGNKFNYYVGFHSNLQKSFDDTKYMNVTFDGIQTKDVKRS